MQFFVYILASHSRVLYTGVTRDLVRRINQHRLGEIPGFTEKYHINRLVYYEETPSVRAAFEREHQIKGWSREKKIRLIEADECWVAGSCTRLVLGSQLAGLSLRSG